MGIGSLTSEPCLLSIGTDDHINKKYTDIENQKKVWKSKLENLYTQKNTLEYTIKSLNKKLASEKNNYDVLKDKEPHILKNQDMSGKDKANFKKEIKQSVEQYNRSLSERQKNMNTLKEIVQKIPDLEKKVKHHILELNTKKQGYQEWISQEKSLPRLIVKGKVASDTKISATCLSIKLPREYNNAVIEEKISERETYGEKTIHIVEQ